MQADAFSYLEDSSDPRTRRWVKHQNEKTIATIEGDSRFREYHDKVRASQRTEDARISEPHAVQGQWAYQLWTSASHPRGIWRRRAFESLFSGAGPWDELLDVDALSRREGRTWVMLPSVPTISPNGRRSLITLSDGGWSLRGAREFDLQSRTFVEGGFRIPDTFLLDMAWKDDHTIVVAADFGPGSLNEKGMPIVVKEWTRGQPLAAAREILRGERTDLGLGLLPQLSSQGRPVIVICRWTAQNERIWWQLEEDGTLSRMNLPPTVAYVLLHQGHYIFQLPTDWVMGDKTWKADSVLSMPVSDISRAKPRVHPVLTPEAETTIIDWQPTKAGLLVYQLVRGNGELANVRYADGHWERKPIAMPKVGSIRHSASSINSAAAFVVYESFLQPKALYAVDTERGETRLIQSDPAEFAAEHLTTEKWEARSSDGTMVPYYITRPTRMKYDGKTPVLIYGYGAMGGTLVPQYSATLGKLWLEHGGVYVLAGVRGGRERGAAWHVTRLDRRHTYADMIAIAEDLVKRGITSAKRIGISGQSAGGLLAAAVTTQRPDLFGAAVLRVAVLDQLRVDLNGVAVGQDADEWGSLDVPQERAFLEKTSPFQNLRKSADFPVPLILTSTTDERVPPAQSRRFAAKMEALGMPFLFYESPEGSHAVATLPEEKARLDAWIFTYLRRELVDRRAEG